MPFYKAHRFHKKEKKWVYMLILTHWNDDPEPGAPLSFSRVVKKGSWSKVLRAYKKALKAEIEPDSYSQYTIVNEEYKTVELIPRTVNIEKTVKAMCHPLGVEGYDPFADE